MKMGEKIGDYLVKYRAKNKMTQKELSKLLGLSTSTISYLENGWIEKCSVPKLALIIKLLGLTPDEAYNILMSFLENTSA